LVNQTLFQIGEEIRALHELLIETGGEITDPEAEAAIGDWLAETRLSLERKVDQYIWLIREFEGRAEVREQAAKALMASAGADGNMAKRLKARLKAFLEVCGISKLQTEHFKLSIQANGGVLPLLIPSDWDDDPANAPEAFQRRTIVLDRDAIREAIREGEDAYGAELGERGTSIRIR
jgi:hypothetical protein